MYEHITSNLISWENLEDHKCDNVKHIYKEKFEILKQYNENPWTDEMRDNLKRNNFTTTQEKNYVCVQIRNRDHCSYRGGNIADWKQLVSRLSDKYEKVYIVGKQNDEQNFSKNVETVNLDRYCSLIKSSGCKASFGPSSGCMILNYIYGRKDLPVHIYFTDNIQTQRKNHILFFGKKTNVAQVNPHLYLDFKLLVEENLRNE